MNDEREKPKGYVLNRDMELTPMAEIRRLRKVIEEKNNAIAEFKKYDRKRKEYYSRFETNYAMMEEQFGNFLECVRDEEGWRTAQMVKAALASGAEREKQFRAKRERAEQAIQSLHDIAQTFGKVEKGLRGLLDYSEAHLSKQDKSYAEKTGSLLLKIMKLAARVEEALSKSKSQ